MSRQRERDLINNCINTQTKNVQNYSTQYQTISKSIPPVFPLSAKLQEILEGYKKPVSTSGYNGLVEVLARIAVIVDVLIDSLPKVEPKYTE